ncbi:hypothetical protein DAPPUDRAFT_233041 [Daphnia pulex]|uniref:Sushi domain-containing protein n=1 Tax=Daphnia pulex TaxID=6669 RepID=E9FT12_DAPPU|nr:hypothetical protein DAPPUDRAFT_233041 [Daphnia pulex]|eukprot:EFX89289.1 hypothetical protein DAPPUDRAFT_233041 [Daphnia pulex]
MELALICFSRGPSLGETRGFFCTQSTEVKLESGCLKPETPEHGEMFVLWSGLLVQFRCKSTDYKLVGAAAVICRNRTWTQDPPVCVHHHQLEAHLASQQQQQQFRALIKGRDNCGEARAEPGYNILSECWPGVGGGVTSGSLHVVPTSLYC